MESENNISQFISEHPTLSKEDTLNKIKEYQLTKDINIRNEIVEGNLALVKMVVNELRKDINLPANDMFLEGTHGLIKACDEFDPTRDISFSTMATVYIKNAILSYLSTTSRMIKIPNYIITKIKKIEKAKDEWLKEHGKAPNIEDIYTKLNGEYKKDDIANVLNYANSVLSLDTITENLTENDNNNTVDDYLKSDTPSPSDIAKQEEKEKAFEQCLLSLPERERDILLSHNIDGSNVTLKDLADKYHISIERVRQIERSTIEKIKEQLSIY